VILRFISVFIEWFWLSHSLLPCPGRLWGPPTIPSLRDGYSLVIRDLRFQKETQITDCRYH